MTTTDLEDRIRERAHAIWESEGCPEGSQERHWEEARAAIAAEEDVGTTDDLQDTELTSDLATQDDPVEDTFLDAGDVEPSSPQEIDSIAPTDLGGRVKDPV